MANFNFNVFVPINSIKKSANLTKSKNNNYVVAGYASTGNVDLDGEVVEPEGIDCEYLMGPNGFIDYEHDMDEVIGYPTENTHVDENGLYVEAELFSDDEHVKRIVKLYNNLKKASVNKKLGFSVEGIVGERSAANKNVIKQVSITGVAVTKHPANMEATWDMLQKSINSKNPETTWKSLTKSDGTFEAGSGTDPSNQTDAGALRPEAFADHVKHITQTLNHYRDEGLLEEFLNKVANCLDTSKSDLEEKSAFLQIATGASKQEVLESMSNQKAKLSDAQKVLDGSGDSDDDSDGDDDSGD